MPKMLFNKIVKYGNKFYDANSEIVVDEKDVTELQQVGGWILEESALPADSTPIVNENSDSGTNVSTQVNTPEEGNSNGSQEGNEAGDNTPPQVSEEELTKEQLEARLDAIDVEFDDINKLVEATKAEIEQLPKRTAKATRDAKVSEVQASETRYAKLEQEYEQVSEKLDALEQGEQ